MPDRRSPSLDDHQQAAGDGGELGQGLGGVMVERAAME